ncbi:hypothetical protein BCCGELA001_23180 [Bradyrhizobium sp. CCGE-LA001]|nr:hypothetical protein BCCGELA001_23180 [Bradyrhizobium sp. CCGE-LA001]
MIKIEYEPDELMVRYLEAVIYLRPDSSFADLHAVANNAHEAAGPVVDEDITLEKVVNWATEARRRIAWRNRTR